MDGRILFYSQLDKGAGWPFCIIAYYRMETAGLFVAGPYFISGIIDSGLSGIVWGFSRNNPIEISEILCYERCTILLGASSPTMLSRAVRIRNRLPVSGTETSGRLGC